MEIEEKDGQKRMENFLKQLFIKCIFIFICVILEFIARTWQITSCCCRRLWFFLLMLGTNAFRIPYSCDRVSWFYFRLYFWTKMHFFLLEGDTNWGLSDWVMGWLNSCGMHFNCRRSRHIVAFSANSQKHFHTLANLVRVTLCCYSHWILYFQAEWTNDGGKST